MRRTMVVRQCRYLTRVFTLLCLALLAWPQDAAAVFSAGLNARSLSFGGNTYLYDVYVPASYTGATPVPLVVDYHGITSDKTAQRLISGFKAQSDTVGFIVAYPLGLFGDAARPTCLAEKPYLVPFSITTQPSVECASGIIAVDPIATLSPSWHAGDFCCGAAFMAGVDDVGFSKALVAAIDAEANINLSRVYATGLSNGGALSHALACEAADTFAAVAPLAFPLPYAPLTNCAPSRPIAVIHFAGLTDSLVPYAGGPLPAYPAVSVVSAAASFTRWRDINGCGSGSPDTTVVTGGSTCETYTSCSAGVEVALCSIASTSPPPTAGHILYTNPDLVLDQVAWDFLSQFELPAPEPPVPALSSRGLLLFLLLALAGGLVVPWRRRVVQRR